MTTSRLNDAEISKPSLVLVVDDEPSICWGFERMLGEEGHRVITASTAEEGLRLAATERPALVLLDVRLPGMDGITALPQFLEVTHSSPVVVMTAFGDLDTAVAAVQRGASDYLTKPFRLDDALKLCRQAIRATAENERPSPAPVIRIHRGETLIGQSAAMQQAFRQIALVANSDLSVLITGETGTGKELVAAAIHRHSHRSNMPYLPIAPVSLSPDLIESELFGHVRGAFTGAAEDRPGLFEQADGGTVLLDEIGDLPLSIQVKLLRILESGQYSRVGEVQFRQCNVRVLAATNADLRQAVQRGEFREDLYYRLNGVHVHLPPLRERLEDIALIAEYVLQTLQYPNAETALDQELLHELQSRPWFGNVRELRNAVEHAAVVARGRSLCIADFPSAQAGRLDSTAAQGSELERVIADWSRGALAKQAIEGGSLHEELMKAIEPTLLRIVLQETGGNRAKAAEMLGIHRGTLRDRLRGYGME